MRQPGYKYTGTFLSELAAAGRERTTIVCGPCGREGSYRLASLIAEHGDVVLPHLLSIVSADCPRRLGMASNLACSAVFRDPVTAEEAAAIKAGRG